MKRILCTAAAIILGTAALIPTQAFAQASISIVIGNAPPPQRVEVVPVSRRGYHWAPGYWDWNGWRHVWVAGHWERARPGHAYQRAEWRHERDGWHLYRGGWQRYPDHDNCDHYDYGGYGRGDRDHDGVPNDVDRDRDGDGMANRYDRMPNNPRRD